MIKQGMKKMHGSTTDANIIARQGAGKFMRMDTGMPHNNPMTKTGTKVMNTMMETYGKKGKQVFYATANKNKSLGKKWHK